MIKQIGRRVSSVLNDRGTPVPTEHRTDEVPAIYAANLSRGTARLARLLGDIVEVSSAGAYVTASDGETYLNCGGYGVFFVGAGHPRIVDAVRRQLETHALASRLFLEPTLALAAQSIANVAPPGIEKVFFTTSGSEAVEAAIKLARLQGKTHLVSMQGGYHGKTMGSLSVTANPDYQDRFLPLLPSVTHVPFGDIDALRNTLHHIASSAAVIVEPIQSEAGVVIPPSGYLKQVSDLCSEVGAFLIVDEVMTGLGRTGQWWQTVEAGAQPDVLLAGKALSGGVCPVAALLATKKAFAPLDRDPFIHTSTFSGAPITAAAVAATIAVISDDDLVRRSRDAGDRILSALRRIVEETPAGEVVGDVRGAGLLIAIEFKSPGEAGDFILRMFENKVLVNNSLNAHPVVRLTPPAVMSDLDEARLIEALLAALVATAASAGAG